MRFMMFFVILISIASYSLQNVMLCYYHCSKYYLSIIFISRMNSLNINISMPMNEKSNQSIKSPTFDNNKIAQIYHKMLMGDKSALSSLQKINLYQPSQPKIQKQSQYEIFTQRGVKPITHESQQSSPIFKQSKNIFTPQNNKNVQKTVTSNEVPKDKIKQMQKFRKYIKEKVNELRNERTSLNKQTSKQSNFIENKQKSKIIQTEDRKNNKIKPHEFSQRKSYDLSNQKPTKVKPLQKLLTSQTQSKNIRVRKTPKQNQRKKQIKQIVQKLPHLKNLKNSKTITQNSIQNEHQKSNHFSDLFQNQITIPIKITKNKKLIQDTKYSKKITEQNLQPKPSSKKIERVKVSLPEMKRQRQQLSLLNQQERETQMEIFNYHKKTKDFINSIKQKYSMNFRNQQLMQISKSRVSSESKSVNVKQSKITNLKQTPSSPQNSNPQSKKELLKVKIVADYQQIQALNKSIQQNKSKLDKLNNQMNRNGFYKYFQNNSHDQIEEEIENESQPEDIDLNMGQTNYSTVMSQIKQRKYPLKKRIQYDTNQSFQQFSDSRNKSVSSRMKLGQKPNYIQNLSKIEQGNEAQHDESKSNKVVANSRLKNLLFS